MSGCAFCDIAADPTLADVVQEWDETIAFLPRGKGALPWTGQVASS